MRRRQIGLVAAAVLIVAGGLGGWRWYSTRDARALRKARADGSVAAYAAFARAFPTSPLRAEAERAAFDSAQKERRITVCREFLKEFPRSEHGAEAKSLIGDLLYDDNDDSWGVEELRQFLLDYPSSSRVAEAKELLRALSAAEAFSKRGGRVFLVPGSAPEGVVPHAENFDLDYITCDSSSRTVLPELGYPLLKGGRTWITYYKMEQDIGPRRGTIQVYNPTPGFGKYWPESGEPREGDLAVKLVDTATGEVVSNEVCIPYRYAY